MLILIEAYNIKHTMVKKYLLTTIIALSAQFCAIHATAQQEADTIVIEQVCNNDKSVSVSGDWVDSKEVNTVQESEIARKMKQAEKAKNAAENDSFGGAITIIAMGIVVLALAVLSLLFLIFGKFSTWMITSQKKRAHGVNDETAEDHHNELDSGETIAAIGLALAEHFGQAHDMEDAILTIRRIKKSYSPWNSKIYNMRSIPPVVHHKENK